MVQPLIDAQQTFDIAVTVWIRGTEKEEEEYLRSIAESDNVPKDEKLVMETGLCHPRRNC